MASEIRSSVTPEGYAHLQNLLSREQGNRALGLQAQQQNMQGLLAMQEAGLEQQRMAQNQGQFEAGLAEAQRGREHALNIMGMQHGYAMSEMEARNRFEASESKAMRDWNDQQTARQNRLQLSIEGLHAKRDLAVRNGEHQVAMQYANLAQQQMNQLSMLSASTAIAMNSVGKTEQQRKALIESTVDAIEKKHMAYKQQIDLAQRSVGSHLGKDAVSDTDADAATFDDFNNRNNSGIMGAVRNISPMELSFEGVGPKVRSGQLSGLQYLNLEPSMIANTVVGLDPTRTVRATAIQGEKSAEEMHDIIAGRQTDNMVKTLGEMGIKGIDEGKARKALQIAFAGNADRAEVQKLLTEANVPLMTVKHLLGAAAEHYEKTGDGSEYQRLRAGLIGAQNDAPGQRSLESESFRKALDAHQIKRDMNRKAYNLFDMPNTENLQAVITGLRRASATGHIESSTRNLIESEHMMSPEEMQRVYEVERKGQQGIDELGNLPKTRADLAAQMYGAQAQFPVNMSGAGLGAEQGYISDLGNLINNINP